MSMVAYRIGILTLIKRHKLTYPGVTQKWYADDAGKLGTFDTLEKYFKVLKRNVPVQGYFPDPTKIINVVHTITSKQERYLSNITALRCAQVHII